MPVKISVVTPNFNGGAHLEKAIESVFVQQGGSFELEHIIVDGGSTDRSLEIVERHRENIATLISEKDRGPADAINKGLARAGGDILCWLNADDYYFPGALKRVVETMRENPGRTIAFGHCPIVDEEGREIRRAITRFKELFYPLSSRFAVQCVNYVSQPAMFFRREAFEQAGPLRTDMVAAWDYDFLLRLWRHGGAVRIGRPPLAAFRWHEASISGRNFRAQFREDWQAAADDAGRLSPQALFHLGAWGGTVLVYSLMARLRRRKGRP